MEKMKKRTWKERWQYQFDNIMSKGTIALIGLLFGITMVVVGIVGILAVFVIGEGGVGSQIWISLMHVLDAGTLTADSLDNIPYIILMSLVTLCGLFVTSILIGIITTGFEAKISDLRKGTSTVLEEGHTVILGFNENIYTLLEALIEANANHSDACIVVVGTQEKEEMEENIADNISDFKTTRIICRSGPLSQSYMLERSAVESSRSILINLYDDVLTIRTILAVSTYLEEKQLYSSGLFMTAVIMEEGNVEAARLAGAGRAEIIFAQNAISRIIAHTCGEPGLSNVMVELFDYDGDELYFEAIPKMYGKTFRETLHCFEKAVVFGICKNGKPLLNPPMDTKVEEGDKLILLEEDDGACQNAVHVLPKETEIREELMIPQDADGAKAKDHTNTPQNLLILGYNDKLSYILAEYDCYAAKGSEVTLICLEEPDLNLETFDSISFRQIRETCTERRVLEEKLPEGSKNILILSDDRLDDETADAQTLLQLIFLRNIAKKTGREFTITAEMKLSENQKLAAMTNVDDFVIGSNLINQLMTQIAENRQLAPLFEDILDEDGSEIYMKPAAGYVKLHVPVDFYTVTESASRKGHVAIGYKKVEEDGYNIITNPLKSDMVVFTEKDFVIVIAED